MSRVRAFKKVAQNSPETSKLQDNIEQWTVPVTASQVIDGLLLQNIELVSGQTNVVEHKLGRNILGWIPVRVRAQARLWDSQDSNQFKSKNLLLNTDANVTVDLWVF